jgi:hypothetical protein
VKHAPLVDPNNVLLPPFHIKPGLMKYSVKSMVKDGEGFKHLSEMFPQVSEAILEEGIFTGPKIRKLICDTSFEGKLNQKELAAWISFAKVVKGFLGNKKDERSCRMFVCEHSRLLSPLFKHETCVLFSETLCTFNLRSAAVDSYVFKADLNYINSVCSVTFCLLCSFSAHLTW